MEDGERLDDDHPVFRTGYSFGIAKAKRISKESVSDIIKRAKNNCGIKLDGKTNMLCHAFRRRFNTILKLQDNANISSIERLMGHSIIIPMDNSYFQPEIDVLFAEYQKGITDLTIDDKTRLLEELRVSQEEKSELEEKNENIKNLMRVQKETTARLDEMSKILTTNLNSELDENKEPSKKDLKLFAKIMRLKMNNDPEYSKEMKVFLLKRPGIPEELKKEISELS